VLPGDRYFGIRSELCFAVVSHGSVREPLRPASRTAMRSPPPPPSGGDTTANVQAVYVRPRLRPLLHPLTGDVGGSSKDVDAEFTEMFEAFDVSVWLGISLSFSSFGRERNRT